MLKKFDSYQEIKSLHPAWKKFKRIGLSPRYWIYRLKWYMVEKIHYVSEFPVHIDIELNNSCNLKCIMCPYNEGPSQNVTFMDFDLVKKIIDEGAQHGLKSIKFNIRGEPLLYKHLEDVVAYAKQRNIVEVMFNTNATLLTKDRAVQLIKSGLDLIIISIDGATKETYEKIRLGAEFKKVVENIRFLCEYRIKNNLTKPMIRLQFVKMKENMHEVPMYIEQWKNYVDVMTANDYSKRVKPEIDRSTRDAKAVARANCPHPWRRLSITSTGNVLMCCGDWYEKGILGNVHTDSLYDLWHGDKMNARRSLLKKCELDKIGACKDCFVLASYKWK